MTAIPAKGIKLLVQLQEKDKALDGLKVELENIPQEFLNKARILRVENGRIF